MVRIFRLRPVLLYI